MLSTENPSCSSSKPSPSSDLVVASGHEGDGHHHNPPIFSIRGYVLKSRSKDIRINWPFREQLLDLCLDNGISDLLPPLEHPGLVRSNCYQRELESKHLTNCAKNKPIFGNGECSSAAYVSSDRSKHSLPEEKRESKILQESIRESDINASSLTSYGLSERISGKQSKKCRFVVRLSAGIENSTEEEDPVSDLAAAVSDPMASKVCPVCKSFTSTSSTTLNAHIDQCLSSDRSNATRDVAEFPRAKVKPRKKRLMADIYTTAPLSTLEDLDRRNGTNWAASLSMVAPSNDMNLDQTRRMKLSPMDIRCNDANLEPRRTPLLLADTVSDDANLETKRMKLSPLDAVSEGNVGDIYIDSNGTKILILSKLDDSPILLSRKKLNMKKQGKWFKSGKGCSITKRKILRQRSSEFMENTPQNRKLSIVEGSYGEIDQVATEGGHISEDQQEKEESGSQLLNANDQVKFSEPSTLGHWVCSKRSDISRKQANKDNNRRPEKMIVNAGKLSVRHIQPDLVHSSIRRGCASNLPTSSEAAASSKTKRTSTLFTTLRDMGSGRKITLPSSNLNYRVSEDVSLVDDPMARVSSPSETYHPPLKGRQSMTSKKRRFPRRTRDLLEGMDVGKGPMFITPERYRKQRSVLGCGKGRRVENYYNGGGNVSTEYLGPISSRGNEASDISDDQTDLSENQEEGSLGMKNPIRSTVTNAQADDASLNPSTEERMESLSRDGTKGEVSAQRSTSCEETQCGDVVSSEVISEEFQREGDEAEPTLHHVEFQTDASFQDPNLHVPCDGEVAFEAIPENPSTNLVRVESNVGQHVIIDMESSGSAASTVPAIPHASPVDDKIKDLEADQCAECNPSQGKMSSMTMRKDDNVRLTLPTEPSCSCSESLARESQFSNHKKSTISHLFAKQPDFFSFQQVCPSLESRNESVVSVDSSKCATNASTTYSESQSAASNPILRLMGKDLVVGKEESPHLPTILPRDSQAKFISFVAPSNVGFISYHNPYSYPTQSFASHQTPIQHLQMRSDRLDSPSPWGMDRIVAPQHHQPRSTIPSYQPQEVIVIDDDPQSLKPVPMTKFPTLLPAVKNPNLMPPPRMFAWLPYQNPHAPGALVPSQREASEGAFMFPSPSSLYFSPTLR